jgi:rhomboid protease GluP
MYDSRVPVMTVILVVILAAIFGLELIYAVEPTVHYFPTRPTLVALGAFDHGMIVGQREWWRLISAGLVHTGAVQLVLVCAALVFAGMTLDRLVGPGWVWFIYLLCAAGGSAVSLWLGRPDAVVAGGGPAVFGMLTTCFACHFHVPEGRMRIQAQEGMLRALLLLLISAVIDIVGFTPAMGDFDPFAYIGAAVAGGLAGLLILALWPEAELVPNLDELAKVFSGVALCVFALAAYGTVRHYQMHSAFVTIIPPDVLPRTQDEAKAQALSLVQRYPRDPRSHLFYAVTLLDQGDLKGAEAELRSGLDLQDVLHSRFQPDMERQLRSRLAVVLSREGRFDEAKAEAQQVCAAVPNAIPPELRNEHLCD